MANVVSVQTALLPPVFDKVRSIIDAVMSFETELQGVLPRDRQVPGNHSSCFHAAQLSELREQLDEPFAIFVCGEFNSGKSSLLNALAGETVAPVGILPTTTDIVALSLHNIPGLVMVDSPGTNSIIEGHKAVTENYLQKSDMILFVTSVERPLSDSEARFLKEVTNVWARKIVVVINKADLFACDEDRQKVRDFVADGITNILGQEVPVFVVSSRTEEGLENLRMFLLESLSEEDKLQLKVRAPLCSLSVYLKEGSDVLLAEQTRVAREREVLERLMSQMRSRVEEAKFFFRIYEERTQGQFALLIQRVKAIVDEHFGLLSMLKQRFFGKELFLKERLRQAVDEVQLEETIERVVREAAESLQSFRKRLHDEAHNALVFRELNKATTIGLGELAGKRVDTSVLADHLRNSADKGLNNFLALGSVGAAAGIGAKIVGTAAYFEVSGLVIMAILGLLGMRALPREQRKAKQEVEETLGKMGASFASALSGCIDQSLGEFLGEFETALSPRLSELQRTGEALSRLASIRDALEQDIKNLSTTSLPPRA